MDELQRVRDTRLLFQYSCEDEFVGAVERIVGRDVIAFVSGLDAHRDFATEVFYFEPNGAAAG